MKEVYIKYNPYALTTEFTVDNRELCQNGNLYNMIFKSRETRLQDWIEELPNELKKEYNTKNFRITFYGTKLDYNDIEQIFKEAKKKDIVNATITHQQAKEAKDKEKEIDKVFEEIKNGPIEELKNEKIKDAFNKVKNNKDFEICVVATMSSGKSTLINALLGKKLMPAAQEACTAIITKIKDSDEENWKVEVYDKEGHPIKQTINIDYNTMKQLNKDEDIREINMTGDIPFVTTKENTLVLVDTPGPNNARNKEHRKIQEKYLGKSSQSLVLYIMEPTFGSDSDDALLSNVADSMKVDGKQSKDRFIFVVNKMDGRTEDDGTINDTLDSVREYLQKKGIENPNLFPIAALPALNIRRVLNKDNIDTLTKRRVEYDIELLNADTMGEDKNLHFEQYATLPRYLKDKINQQLEKDMQNNDEYKDYLQALVHTGVPSVEEAIKQYVDKYATTKRIRELVDTFKSHIESQRYFEDLKTKITKNEEAGKELEKQINELNEKINSGETAKEFTNQMDATIKVIEEESIKELENIIVPVQDMITKKIDTTWKAKVLVNKTYAYEDISFKEAITLIENLDKLPEFQRKEIQEDLQEHGEEACKISIEEAKKEKLHLETFVKEKIIPQFEETTKEVITNKLSATSDQLLEDYKNRLGTLFEEINKDNNSTFAIDPFNLIQGDLQNINVNININDIVKEEEVWVTNYDKKWYKFWTWFDEDGHYRTEQYIDLKTLLEKYFAAVQEDLYKKQEETLNYIKEQSKKIKANLVKEFNVLDNKLKEKGNELTKCMNNKTNIEQTIKECEEKQNWLEMISKEINHILEI